MKKTFLAKCNYNIVVPEVRHRPVILQYLNSITYLSKSRIHAISLSLSASGPGSILVTIDKLSNSDSNKPSHILLQ